MNEKLNARRVGLTLAVVGGILSLACLLLIVIFSDTAISFFGYIFHGIDVSSIMVSEIAFSGAIIGVIEVIVISFIAGWLFAKVYNAFA